MHRFFNRDKTFISLEIKNLDSLSFKQTFLMSQKKEWKNKSEEGFFSLCKESYWCWSQKRFRWEIHAGKSLVWAFCEMKNCLRWLFWKCFFTFSRCSAAYWTIHYKALWVMKLISERASWVKIDRSLFTSNFERCAFSIASSSSRDVWFILLKLLAVKSTIDVNHPRSVSSKSKRQLYSSTLDSYLSKLRSIPGVKISFAIKVN